MAHKVITIDSILGGIGPTDNYARPDQYGASIGIDPDLPRDDSSVGTSGFLRPSGMEKFSGSTVTDAPLWILTNPKTATIYVYAKDGKVHSVANNFTMNSDVGTPTSGAGNGAAYYDNHAYFATPTNISRYGPLDGSPSLTNTVWTGATLGFLTALTNTTYPSLQGIPIPNHAMHVHVDQKLYFCDVTSGNKGILSYIKTTKTTVEGDTNSASAYNALDFGYGLYPTCLETYGTDLAIGLIEGTNTTTKQANARIAFWDTTSTSFQKMTTVELPDPLITALKNVNGILYAFTGNASGGYRVLQFSGGYTWQEVAADEEGMPPFAGAVDHELNRIAWGSYVTYPENAALVYGYGSKFSDLPKAVHGILKSTSATSTNQTVTAFKYVLHQNLSMPRVIVGWKDNSSQGLDKVTSTPDYSNGSVWRSQMFRIGQPFRIRKLRIPTIQAVNTNRIITPKIVLDDFSSTSTLTVINNTNYPNLERNVRQTPDVYGKHNFLLELRWTGSSLIGVSLPITIEVELLNN